MDTFPFCRCCGADRQSEYRALPLCSRCVSGGCQECRDRLQKSESGPLRLCMCCGADRQLKHRALPFCAWCMSGRCRRCRSRVRAAISEVYPKAINLVGRSPGPRMLCGWGCGARLTNGEMRRHFTDCPQAAHGAGSDAEATSRRTAARAAHALRLALRREAHHHEDAAALRSLPASSEGFLREACSSIGMARTRQCASPAGAARFLSGWPGLRTAIARSGGGERGFGRQGGSRIVGPALDTTRRASSAGAVGR